MKITDIAPQKRRKDRYSIYLDGKYAVSLSENELLDAALRIGDEIAPADLEALEKQSDLGKALDRVYNFLSYRDRSWREVETYLRRKDYDEELIAAIKDRLESQNIVNDERFARNWARARQEFDGKSHRQIKAELQQKGISSLAIEVALAEEELEPELDTVLRTIQQKRLLQRYPEHQKLLQHLAGKGFSIDTIKAALQQLEDGEISS